MRRFGSARQRSADSPRPRGGSRNRGNRVQVMSHDARSRTYLFAQRFLSA
jgi:hypothetical protein